ncbi:glycosyltransferase [Marinobacter sp. SS13-12]|uniref:glycosyltransferase n=1 Tax=Marinobacter sp. SS13-12 TaxID=3050451 RepID=UPI0025521584|nr:glycosyltransferase [Marinobacter sp. SS13-12]MDK8464259.1 glycosyltransferase [Marinobacter sp. SS13-12]
MNYPKVEPFMDLSVIIPAFNEEDYVGQCLSSVKEVLAERDIVYEILLLDNGSCDRTSQIASSFSGTSVFNISRTSVSQARNFGAQKAKGRVFAFIDADVVLKNVWGESIETLCKSGKRLFVTGYQYGVRDEPSWIEKYWFSNLKSNHISGGNLIVGREAFFKIGGFDPGLKTGEDVDFCNRAKNNPQINFELNPKLKSVHLGYPKNIKNFMKREYWHGEGDFRSFQSFCKSKIALVAIGYGLAHLIMLGLLIRGEYAEFLVLVILFILFNIVISSVRFKKSPKIAIFYNSILNYFYFMARFFSLFKAVKNRAKNY